MLEKKVKALRDLELKTYFGSHYLSEGEVKTIRFKNQNTFEAQVKLGNLVEADRDEPEGSNIPIILPDEMSEDEIVEIRPTEQSEELGHDVDTAPPEALPELEETPEEPIEENLPIVEDLNLNEECIEENLENPAPTMDLLESNAEISIDEQNTNLPELEPGEFIEDEE